MSSGFITEAEIAEARKRKQEEWDKVRQPHEPAEPEEAPYERSLYDRLKDNKMKKDMEYEEAHKLKNLIRGLDDDEVQFLEMVDKNKIDAEKQQMREEKKELEDFRNRVATLQEESIEKKIQLEIKQTKVKNTTAPTRPTQKSLVALGIKRKNGDISGTGSGIKEPKQSKQSSGSETIAATTLDANADNSKTQETHSRTYDVIKTDQFDRGLLKCRAILPGIGPYYESSDSEISTGSEDEPENTIGKYDLVGRKQHKKKQCQED